MFIPRSVMVVVRKELLVGKVTVMVLITDIEAGNSPEDRAMLGKPNMVHVRFPDNVFLHKR